MCSGVPPSPPLRSHSFSSMLLIRAEAAPRRARTAARCPGGGVRSAARPGGRRAGPRSAPGSGGRSPRSIYYSAWGQEPLSAQLGPRRPALKLARAERGPAATRAGEGSQGAAFAPRTALGGALYLPLGKCRTVGRRRKRSVRRDLSAA